MTDVQQLIRALGERTLWEGLEIGEIAWKWMLLSQAPDILAAMSNLDLHDVSEYYRLCFRGFLPPSGFCAALSRWNLSPLGQRFFEILEHVDTGHLETQEPDSHWSIEEDITAFLAYARCGCCVQIGSRSPAACAQRLQRIKHCLFDAGLVQYVGILEEEESSDEEEQDANSDEDEDTHFPIEAKEQGIRSDDDLSLSTDDRSPPSPSRQQLSGEARRSKSQAKRDRAAAARQGKRDLHEGETEGSHQGRLLRDDSAICDDVHTRLEVMLRYAAERITGRRTCRYNEEEQNFWINCWLFGQRAFQFMATMMKGPCLNTVKSWINARNVPMFSDYLSLEKIPQLIDWWLGPTAPGWLNLAVDALKVDEDIYITSEGEIVGVVSQDVAMRCLGGRTLQEFRDNPEAYSSFWSANWAEKNVVGGLFVVMACPVSRATAFPVHAILAKGGSANETVDSHVAAIAAEFKKLGWKPAFYSTDADTHYRSALTRHFDGLLHSFSADFKNVARLRLVEGFMCNDAPHIMKRARSQLVRHGHLYRTYNDCQLGKRRRNPIFNGVSPALLRTCDPSLMQSWFRNNGTDAMDDFYPMWIFHPNLLLRICAALSWDTGVPTGDPPDFKGVDATLQLKSALLYIMPMCCMNCVLRAKNCGRKQREQWAYVGMFLMMLYWGWLKIDGKPKKDGSDTEVKREAFESLFTMDVCEDSILYFAAVIYALQQIEGEWSLTRIGTILDEHFFSSLRFRGGKEQTLKSLREGFRVYGLTRKNPYATEKVVRFRRAYDTGRVPRGAVILSDYEVQQALIFAVRVITQCGILITTSHPFYSLVGHIKVPPTRSCWEKTVLRDLCTAQFCGHQPKRRYNSYWCVHANKYRLSKRTGRQIKARYATSTCTEASEESKK